MGRRAFLLRILWGLSLLSFSVVTGVADAAARTRHVPPRLAASRRKLAKRLLGRPVVMIDPGHGGKDPGAIGISGTYEKQVVLATARHLKHLLEASGRYSVRMTRDRDVFLSLQRRVALAEQQGAALFISLHANALKQRNVRGASVYTFAAKASDRQSAALAQRENEHDSIGVSGFGDMDPKVQGILSGLVVRETHFGAVHLQSATVKRLAPRVRMTAHPVRSARFAVLRSSRIPSVLVEMGFISNRNDERLLKQSRHQNVVATAITESVGDYFKSAKSGGLFAK